MPAPSPLAVVYQVLQGVHLQAKTNASIFQKNEAATRAALIDPVLRVLGWDTGNVQMVEPEKSLGNELRVDYLLKDAAQKPFLVIEAKCLGSTLDKYGYVGKILGYALTLNVQTVCITDGISWHIHSNLQRGKAEPIAFTLAEDTLLLAATQLVHWLDAAQCGHGLPAVEPSATAKQVAVPLVAQNGKPAKETKQHLKLTKRPAPSSRFIELTQVDLPSLPPGQKPKELRLPNGEIIQIRTWKDILLGVCRLALATNDNIRLPLPDKAGKTRFLFAAEKPLVGSSSPASYKDKPLFICTHYSAADCIANALHAAKQIPQSQTSTTVAVGF